jgi:hypothetical protein
VTNSSFSLSSKVMCFLSMGVLKTSSSLASSLSGISVLVDFLFLDDSKEDEGRGISMLTCLCFTDPVTDEPVTGSASGPASLTRTASFVLFSGVSNPLGSSPTGSSCVACSCSCRCSCPGCPSCCGCCCCCCCCCCTLSCTSCFSCS